MTAITMTRNRATRDYGVTHNVEWGNTAYDDPPLFEFKCPDCDCPLTVEKLSNIGVPYHLIGGGAIVIGCPASFATLKIAKDGTVTLKHRDKPKE